MALVHDPRFMVLTPLHRCDPGMAIAAVRAGAVGLLDLGGSIPSKDAHQSVMALLRNCLDSTSWGLRLDAWGEAGRVERLLSELSAPVPVLVLAGLGAQGLPAEAHRLTQGLQSEVWVECCTEEQALAAELAGFKGLILKGNEAGGRVGPDTSFVLLQRLRSRLRIPFLVQGGMGRQTLAAAMLAGASGAVLSEVLWLAREAPFGRAQRDRWSKLDGSETVALGRGETAFRFYRHAIGSALQSILDEADRGADVQDLLRQRWIENPPDDPLIAMGQDIAWAASMAARSVTVGGILADLRDSVRRSMTRARKSPVLASGSPWAQAHGCRYPIVQGPMTRVSDVVPFAQTVAKHGALPCLSLALMGGAALRELLQNARNQLARQPYGVGLLGFLPEALRKEQFKVVLEMRPPFAIIAGGRPSQAREMEAAGIRTYLHVPSPYLLETFWKEGARNFVLEGRECGGHVGPRSSFVLWQSAVEVLAGKPAAELAEANILYAGGIHDALSAAMAAVVAGPLIERGARFGVLMGTAYIFTLEAVSDGAISVEFQRQALACRKTALLETAPGHAIRCAQTPFADEFEIQRRAMAERNVSAAERRMALEMLNLGRLHLASRGLKHSEDAGPDGQTRRIRVDQETQAREGLFMLGDLAMLRHEPCSVAELHTSVCEGATAIFDQIESAPVTRLHEVEGRRGSEDIAVIGMACMLPQSPDLSSYWNNMLRSFQAFQRVPADRFNLENFYDPDRLARDRIYARTGAFLEPVRFDPLRYRIPPASLAHVEPCQLLALEVARRALEDAGYGRRAFARERTAVFFASPMNHDMAIAYSSRTMFRHYLSQTKSLDAGQRSRVLDEIADLLPEWTEDSFPGSLPNIASGRISNRLDLRGPNCVVDAACASSLAALYLALSELRTGRSDMALVGAADLSNNLMCFMSFSKTQALTPGDRPRPFDAAADGIVVGEGVGAVILKRLSDAERDGDRIYAVLKGIGSSSDGCHRTLTAPSPDGQALALQRAYQDAGVSPRTIALVEAHATGTTAGDRSELASLAAVLESSGRPAGSCAVGSVKSMIGHAKTAAGIVSLIKTVLSLHEKVLPPTAGVEKPNPELERPGNPLYVNTRPRPWVQASGDGPRRAGLSAFGFGGTNFHAVLEEYVKTPLPGTEISHHARPVELLCFARPSLPELTESLRALHALLSPRLERVWPGLAQAIQAEADVHNTSSGHAGGVRLALCAGSLQEFRGLLEQVLEKGPAEAVRANRNVVFFSEAAAVLPADVCFLFPGQGSQRTGMLGDLLMGSPWALPLFGEAESVLRPFLEHPLSDFIYPVPSFAPDAETEAERRLRDTRVAQPALGVVDLFALDVLSRFGLQPGAVAGHSYGEWVALCAAGVISRPDLWRASAVRGVALSAAGKSTPGTMAAVVGSASQVEGLIRKHELRVCVANLNGPNQTVVSGRVADVESAVKAFTAEGLSARRIPVSAAFHSPAMESAVPEIECSLASINFAPARLPVYSNTTAGVYPAEADAQRRLLVSHLTRPVRFGEEVRAIHSSGARVFVECGPGRVLTGLVRRILEGQPHHCLTLDLPDVDGWQSLARLLAEAWALGLPVKTEAWYGGRGWNWSTSQECIAECDPARLEKPTDWIVKASGNVPVTPLPGSRPGSAAPVASTAMQRPATALSVSLLPSISSQSISPANRDSICMPDHRSIPTPGELPPGRDPQVFAQYQAVMAQWLEIMREQQRLQERFLDQQERLISAWLGEGQDASASAAMGRSASSGRVGLFVPPAPVLPVLEPIQGTPPARVIRPAVASATAGAAPQPSVAAQNSAVETDGLETDGAIPLQEISTEKFKADLLLAVSERTGYPVEVLDLETPLESGMGIDSIKMVEIFSSLKPYHPFFKTRVGEGDEAIARFLQLKSLGETIRHFDAELKAAQANGGVERASSGALHSSAPRKMPDSGCQRYGLITQPLPACADPEQGIRLPQDQVVLLCGSAPGVREALASRGCQVVELVPGAEAARKVDGKRYEARLDDPDSLRTVHRLIAEEHPGQVGMVVNLLGLSPEFQDAPPLDFLSAERLSLQVFSVVKEFVEPLRKAAAHGGGWLLNINRDLTSRNGSEPLSPLAASGTVGFLKALKRECPELRVKSLLLASSLDLPGVLLEELTEDGGPVEVIRTPNMRATREARPETAVEGASLVADGDVVLITGGARGIGAVAARGLATTARVRLVLAGQSPLPPEEALETRRLVDVQALRRVLLDQARKRGNKPDLQAIERAVADTLKAREIQASLQSLREAGAEVEYQTVDVRDEKDVRRLIDDVYARHGRLDGVVHGAGVLHDSLVRAKTPDAFLDVFRTKVQSAAVLASALRPESLKFLLFFSSVASHIGSPGQTDYSAANAYLNRLARHLDGIWPGRVAAILWGPWDRGMVTPNLQRLYATQGIEVLSSAEGLAAFQAELRTSGKGKPEVLICKHLDKLAKATLFAAPQTLLSSILAGAGDSAG